ncbi:MAG: plastocyanin/azurin family copper-binding protein [Dehalococcoidia bacterium]|jgi:uncharacterized cupredoxin-like copper-binding protein|nr:plastocyanin/azurin family copper-binding protein [Dehalococcoidia bacterium]
MRRRLAAISPAITAISIIVFALLATACGDDGPAEPIVDVLTGLDPEASLALELLDIKFGEDELSVAAGAIVAIVLENSGRLDHDFTIRKIAADVSASGQQRRGKFDVHLSLRGGESGQLLLRVSAPGAYSFFCNVPGHRGAGMEGTLTVTP